MSDQPTPIPLPNSEQFYLDNPDGEKYLIQISWPLQWLDRQVRCQSLPVMYITDGNALFLTATEAAWRREAASHFSGGGIIVSIGYPLKGKLYDSKRRSKDLTPPTATPVPSYGGADALLNFIEHAVRPAVRSRFPHSSISREALYGHSYGGLFALHALFTRPNAFDCYVASSPSLWWNKSCIFDEAQSFLQGKNTAHNSHKIEELPSLLISLGSLEQYPSRWAEESLDHYQDRKKLAADLKMADNSLHLIKMLRGSDRLHTTIYQEYDGEDHTSVMSCSINRALIKFFEEWPVLRS